MGGAVGHDLFPLLQLAGLSAIQGADPGHQGSPASLGDAPYVGAGGLSYLCVQHPSLLRGSSAWLVFSLPWCCSGVSGRGQSFVELNSALGPRPWLREGGMLAGAMGKLTGRQRELCIVLQCFQEPPRPLNMLDEV